MLMVFLLMSILVVNFRSFVFALLKKNYIAFNYISGSNLVRMITPCYCNLYELY